MNFVSSKKCGIGNRTKHAPKYDPTSLYKPRNAALLKNQKYLPRNGQKKKRTEAERKIEDERNPPRESSGHLNDGIALCYAGSSLEHLNVVHCSVVLLLQVADVLNGLAQHPGLTHSQLILPVAELAIGAVIFRKVGPGSDQAISELFKLVVQVGSVTLLHDVVCARVLAGAVGIGRVGTAAGWAAGARRRLDGRVRLHLLLDGGGHLCRSGRCAAVASVGNPRAVVAGVRLDIRVLKCPLGRRSGSRRHGRAAMRAMLLLPGVGKGIMELLLSIWECGRSHESFRIEISANHLGHRHDPSMDHGIWHTSVAPGAGRHGIVPEAGELIGARQIPSISRHGHVCMVQVGVKMMSVGGTIGRVIEILAWVGVHVDTHESRGRHCKRVKMRLCGYVLASLSVGRLLRQMDVDA